MEKVPVASIQGLGGTVPGRQLLDILTRIKPPDRHRNQRPNTPMTDTPTTKRLPGKVADKRSGPASAAHNRLRNAAEDARSGDARLMR
jgi:hypothetical protein